MSNRDQWWAKIFGLSHYWFEHFRFSGTQFDQHIRNLKYANIIASNPSNYSYSEGTGPEGARARVYISYLFSPYHYQKSSENTFIVFTE